MKWSAHLRLPFKIRYNTRGQCGTNPHQSRTTRAARQLSLLYSFPPRTGADRTTSQPAESSTSAASRPASIPRPEAQPLSLCFPNKAGTAETEKGRQANDNPQQLKLLSTDTSRLEEKNQTSAMESRLVFTTHTRLRGGDYLSWTPSAVPVPERGSIDPIPIPEDRPGARSLLHVWNGAFSPSSQSPACRDVSRPNATGRGGTG